LIYFCYYSILLSIYDFGNDIKDDFLSKKKNGLNLPVLHVKINQMST